MHDEAVLICCMLLMLFFFAFLDGSVDHGRRCTTTYCTSEVRRPMTRCHHRVAVSLQTWSRDVFFVCVGCGVQVVPLYTYSTYTIP